MYVKYFANFKVLYKCQLLFLVITYITILLFLWENPIKLKIFVLDRNLATVSEIAPLIVFIYSLEARED